MALPAQCQAINTLCNFFSAARRGCRPGRSPAPFLVPVVTRNPHPLYPRVGNGVRIVAHPPRHRRAITLEPLACGWSFHLHPSRGRSRQPAGTPRRVACPFRLASSRHALPARLQTSFQASWGPSTPFSYPLPIHGDPRRIRPAIPCSRGPPSPPASRPPASRPRSRRLPGQKCPVRARRATSPHPLSIPPHPPGGSGIRFAHPGNRPGHPAPFPPHPCPPSTPPKPPHLQPFPGSVPARGYYVRRSFPVRPRPPFAILLASLRHPSHVPPSFPCPLIKDNCRPLSGCLPGVKVPQKAPEWPLFSFPGSKIYLNCLFCVFLYILLLHI